MTEAELRCEAYGHRSFKALSRDLESDLQRYLNKSPENQAAGNSFKSRLSARLTPEWMALAVYRFSHFLYLNGWRRLSVVLFAVNSAMHRTFIPPSSCAGPGFHLPHPAGVTFIGSAGSDLTLYSLAVCCPLRWDDPADHGPFLGDRVLIGAHAAVMGPARVGDDARFAPGVRVTQDIPQGRIGLNDFLRPRFVPQLALKEH